MFRTVCQRGPLAGSSGSNTLPRGHRPTVAIVGLERPYSSMHCSKLYNIVIGNALRDELDGVSFDIDKVTSWPAIEPIET